jgi:predicted DsbA family dithiol-disulfide isomerase
MKAFDDSAQFEVKWLPFQLNANAPNVGSSKVEAYMQKFGRSRSQVMQMAESFKQNFTSVGLPFSMDGLTGNTFNGHRLASYCHQKGGAAMQDVLMEELFKNYFAEGKAPCDNEVLLAAAKKAGLEDSEASSVVFDENKHKKETQEELGIGRQMRVSGVPYFVVTKDGNNQKYALSGAQPSEAFTEIFETLLE